MYVFLGSSAKQQSQLKVYAYMYLCYVCMHRCFKSPLRDYEAYEAYTHTTKLRSPMHLFYTHIRIRVLKVL